VLAAVVLLQVGVGVGLPVMTKFMTPLGAVAPLDPVTVALKSSEPPRVGVERVLMATIGATAATKVADEEEVAPTAL